MGAGVLRIDTTNPPGNEMRSAAFSSKRFSMPKDRKTAYRYVPGRADIWARVPHNTTEAKTSDHFVEPYGRGHHDASHWKAPPFSAAILGDSIYGRGAQDMKAKACSVGRNGHAEA